MGSQLDHDFLWNGITTVMHGCAGLQDLKETSDGNMLGAFVLVHQSQLLLCNISNLRRTGE